MNVNPLIGIPSPRHIPIVVEALNKVKQDKLWLKDNFDELQVYELMRNYFLKNTKYTHLVILPDDLLVDIEAFEKLITDLKKKDYPVLSGICNFNCDKWETYNIDLAIDYNHQTGKAYLLANEIPHFDYYVPTGKLKGIKRVAFSGFPITFIRRDVVEKIPFGSTGKGIDSQFSVDLLKKKIDQYVDFDARSLHLKGIENCEDIGFLMTFQFDNNISTQVNFKRKVTPKMILEPKEGNKTELDLSNYLNIVTTNE